MGTPPLPQEFAPPRQPTLHCADGAADNRRNVLVGVLLQIGQQHHVPVECRERCQGLLYLVLDDERQLRLDGPWLRPRIVRERDGLVSSGAWSCAARDGRQPLASVPRHAALLSDVLLQRGQEPCQPVLSARRRYKSLKKQGIHPMLGEDGLLL